MYKYIQLNDKGFYVPKGNLPKFPENINSIKIIRDFLSNRTLSEEILIHPELINPNFEAVQDSFGLSIYDKKEYEQYSKLLNEFFSDREIYDRELVIMKEENLKFNIPKEYTELLVELKNKIEQLETDLVYQKRLVKSFYSEEV